jgi:hypothetical protein
MLGVAAAEDGGARCEAGANADDTITVTCYSFPAGTLYITLTSIFSRPSTSTAFIRVSTTTCPQGKSGLGCNANLVFLNVSNIPQMNGTLPVYSGSGFFPSTVYYIPFAVNSTFSLNITVGASGNGNGQMVYGVGTFPFADDVSDQSTGYLYGDDIESFDTASPVTLYLTPQDTVLGNTVYFTISNEDTTTALSYSISASSFIPSTTTGVTGVTVVTGVTSVSGTTASGSGTTASGTTASGTTATGATTSVVTTSSGTSTSGKVTTTGSGANMLVVPVVLLASLLLALLF